MIITNITLVFTAVFNHIFQLMSVYMSNFMMTTSPSMDQRQLGPLVLEILRSPTFSKWIIKISSQLHTISHSRTHLAQCCANTKSKGAIAQKFIQSMSAVAVYSQRDIQRKL